MAGGSSLLLIFPLRPAKTNASHIYAKLDKINDIRNRIAHHEPICFDSRNNISTVYAKEHYQYILDLLWWMGIDSKELLIGIDNVLLKIHNIDCI